MEREKFVVERKRLELEDRRLSLGGSETGVSFSPRVSGVFDAVGSLRLVPRFCEQDPDVFFSLFERVAESRGWSDSDRTLLLQCVLTGKAQEAYSALTIVESREYATVKASVLRAYELYLRHIGRGSGHGRSRVGRRMLSLRGSSVLISVAGVLL